MQISYTHSQAETKNRANSCCPDNPTANSSPRVISSGAANVVGLFAVMWSVMWSAAGSHVINSRLLMDIDGIYCLYTIQFGETNQIAGTVKCKCKYVVSHGAASSYAAMCMVAGSRPVLVIAWEWLIGLTLLCGCSGALEISHNKFLRANK